MALILQDVTTLEKYSVIIEDGRLELIAVADNIEISSQYTIIDNETGFAYSLIVNNGKLMLQEV